ncbi:DUF1993 domain-containing protein [Mycobacterium sp. KBS0706]|jgi:hypothetical protein|uniref:DUF1993 domain-containing protein n=1 Tax=Mycobacterium sp. KBS0706 TaxID=2578109 RepID=UPI00110FBCB3|nr:DUF1993 domain-containing protein [Mycobacterium sp. KBS0706]TSD84453.1 DUF1993 domain-containing protein [Mycobacterium sp. KBS0706]
MTLSMYQASVPVFARMLGNCGGILRKAEAHAVRAGLDPATLLEARLAPDMFPLHRQVQIAADGARGAAARLAGLALPDPEAEDFAVFNRGIQHRFATTAASFPELTARLDAAIAFVETLRPEQIDGSEARMVDVTMGGRTRRFAGQPFLLHYALPNLHFHIAMAYAILRHAGVALGKQDFEGPPVYSSLP